MLKIINLRTSVQSTLSLEDIVCKEYPSLRGKIKRIHLVRKAVDARKNREISFVYTLFVDVSDEGKVMKSLSRKKNVSLLERNEPEPIVHGTEELRTRPIVVGFGPAGMTAALYLAKEGYAPIVLERGQDVDRRAEDVAAFWEKGDFKSTSNVQFGEGGAGAFSDGKLTTRVTHPRLHEITKLFVSFGAPEEILYKHKPHVGTDILRKMVKRLREEIISLGGEVRFGAQVTDLVLENGHIKEVVVNDEYTLPAQTVLLGIGHSARDTYHMLYKRGVTLEPKPLAVGVRIEHEQCIIDENQYGENYEELALGAADYSLVYHDKESGRTAYSFCMCPGGLVVASASEQGQVVTNGMSLYSRDTGIANSALVVSVGSQDYGEHPLAGIEFQRKWEKKAFALGGKTYKAPYQTVGSFLGTGEVEVGVHTYQPGVVEADLHECLPRFVGEVLERALPYFGQKIKGFDAPHVCMTGVETRTSAPVRLLRSGERTSVSVNGLYPMGEGAGYAGGIMSAALDGAESAIAVMKRFAPKVESLEDK